MSTIKKPRQKRLTIYNTDRYFNINLLMKAELDTKIKVTKLNEKEIEAEMDALKQESKRMNIRNNKEYIVYQESYSNDTLLAKLIDHAGGLTYYTDTVVPYYVLRGLANNVTSEVVYSSRKKFSYDEVDNVVMSFMGCPVIVDVPVVVPDISPYEVLFMLHPLKTNVDKVQLSFPRLTPDEISERHLRYYHRVGEYYEVKPKIKYKYFKYIQTSLSIWAMNIHLICDSEEDYSAVNSMVQKDLDKRNPNRVKGRVSADE